MSANSDFYDHKRSAHKGDYRKGCSDCEQTWAALVTASKAKAGATNLDEPRPNRSDDDIPF